MNNNNLWQVSASNRLQTSPLATTATADLVIIGAGFTGCSAALQAADEGLKVCLLEAQTISYGGSGRNVGLVNAGLWLTPQQITERIGSDAAASLNKQLATGPDLVYSLIQKHAIECQARRAGTLYCAHSKAVMQDLAQRQQQLQAQGAKVSLLDAHEARQRTGTSSYFGALYDPRAGTVQPLAYCHGLAKAAQQAGAEIYEHSPAIHVRRHQGEWQVRTPKGVVSAKRLLLATNAYHVEGLGLPAPKLIPVYFFQMATAPLTANQLAPILPNGEGCWDSALVMSSFRKDAAGRLIVGGVGQLGHVASSCHQAWAGRKLVDLYPHLKGTPFQYAWAGAIGMTSTRIPKIIALGQRAYGVCGYSGRGIAPGTVFGQALAKALISGDESGLPIRPVSQQRESLVGLKRCYYEAGAVATHVVANR